MGDDHADLGMSEPVPPDARAAVDFADSAFLAPGGPRPRRHDDDEEGSDVAEDDDAESANSAQIAGNAKADMNVEEEKEKEKELPAHACA